MKEVLDFCYLQHEPSVIYNALLIDWLYILDCTENFLKYLNAFQVAIMFIYVVSIVIYFS
jgi:hypothetical protein